MTEGRRLILRRLGFLVGIVMILLVLDLFLGSTLYVQVADSVVLAGFVYYLVRSLLSESVGLRRLKERGAVGSPKASGPISKMGSTVGLAMAGDYNARAELARILGETGGADTTRSRATPEIAMVVSPTRPDPTSKRVKPTKKSREEYLRALERALSSAAEEVGRDA